MKPQPIPANGEKPCACCKRFHRKLYNVDGYWLGAACAEDYALYLRNSNITCSYWIGFEKKHAKVHKMVTGT